MKFILRNVLSCLVIEKDVHTSWSNLERKFLSPLLPSYDKLINVTEVRHRPRIFMFIMRNRSNIIASTPSQPLVSNSWLKIFPRGLWIYLLYPRQKCCPGSVQMRGRLVTSLDQKNCIRSELHNWLVQSNSLTVLSIPPSPELAV